MIVESADSADVSIIVPAHNAAKYLDECVGSILRQSYPNLQVILVDDGSTDSTADICRAYAERDARVSAVTIGNGGTSVARNAGLSRVRGRYVYFMDADDILSEQAIERAVVAAEVEQADVVQFNADSFVDGVSVRHQYGSTESVRKYATDAGFKVMMRMKRRGEYSHAVWRNLVRSDYLRAIGNTFIEGIVHQDLLWTFKTYLYASRVAHLDESLYHYRIRPGAITTTLNSELSVAAHLRMLREMICLSQDADLSDGQRNAVSTVARAYFQFAMLKYYLLSSEAQQRHRSTVASVASEMRSVSPGSNVRMWVTYRAVAFFGRCGLIRMTHTIARPVSHILRGRWA